jgi:hypothetical protein
MRRVLVQCTLWCHPLNQRQAASRRSRTSAKSDNNTNLSWMRLTCIGHGKSSRSIGLGTSITVHATYTLPPPLPHE